MTEESKMNSLEKAIEKWRRDNNLAGVENLTKAVESILIYAVIMVARTNRNSFEIGGDVRGGVKKSDDETYVFDFAVKKEQQIEPEKKELN
jgi:hypothetical protein